MVWCTAPLCLLWMLLLVLAFVVGHKPTHVVVCACQNVTFLSFVCFTTRYSFFHTLNPSSFIPPEVWYLSSQILYVRKLRSIESFDRCISNIEIVLLYRFFFCQRYRIKLDSLSISDISNTKAAPLRPCRFDALVFVVSSVSVFIGLIDTVSGAYIEVALIATGAISNSMIDNLEDQEVRQICMEQHMAGSQACVCVIFTLKKIEAGPVCSPTWQATWWLLYPDRYFLYSTPS